MPRLAALACALVLAPAASLPAQSIRGALIERETGRPIDAAFVVVLDSAGQQVGGVLTDTAGAFLLRLPAAGRYTLRAERIGYRSTTSPALDVAAGEELDYRMEVPLEAIELLGISVERGRRCVVRPAEGLATAQVWEEARKALANAAWLERQGVLRFDLSRYERDLDPMQLRVLRETTRASSSYGSRPYVSLPADELAERGYVQETGDGEMYFAPDAEALLSDAFLDTHCMRLTPSADPSDGLIGLAFEPVPDRRVPEIRGTLWLDASTAALRHLEFRYVGLELGVPTDRIGGRVEFEMLPSGGWIVRRWSIRMPAIGIHRRHDARTGPVDEHRLIGFREEGGEVVGIHDARVDSRTRVVRATVRGLVFDSSRSAPLAGALVYLSGTGHATRTGDDGRFIIEDVPDGAYTVAVAHPRLDSLPGFPAPTAEITLRNGETTTIRLAIPSIAAALAAACPEPVTDPPPGVLPGDRRGVIAGLVHDADRRPIDGARVVLSWSRWRIGASPAAGRTNPGTTREPVSSGTTIVAEQPWRAEAVTDSRGRYSVCGLPAEVPIRVRARADGRASDEVEVIIPPDGIARRDLGVGGAGVPDRDSRAS